MCLLRHTFLERTSIDAVQIESLVARYSKSVSNSLAFCRTAGSFCVKGISDHITQYTSERAICCGNHVVYIRRFLQMPLKGNEGNTYLQFLAAMRKYLNLWATEAASCLLDTENLMEFTDVLESFIDPPVALAEVRYI